MNNNSENEHQIQFNHEEELNTSVDSQPEIPNNNFLESSRNNYLRARKTSGFLKILIFIVILIICIPIGYLCLNIIKLPSNTKKVVEEISEAKKSTAKSSSLMFFDSIEYYAGFSSASITLQEYEVAVPQSESEYITCSTSDGMTWIGDVLETSTSCDEFMKAVISQMRGKSPDEAKIIFDKNGIVQQGSWTKYNNIYCLFDGHSIENISTKKPE